MTDTQEAKKQEWLTRVAQHPETTEADYAAAAAILRDPWLRDEKADVSNLVRLQLVTVSEDGLKTALLLGF